MLVSGLQIRTWKPSDCKSGGTSMLTPELRMSPINGSSAVQVYAITALPFAFAIAFHVYILPQARRSVTVMPHSDAASSVCSLFRLAYRVFSGCRIGVRHDSYRLPGLK